MSHTAVRRGLLSVMLGAALLTALPVDGAQAPSGSASGRQPAADGRQPAAERPSTPAPVFVDSADADQTRQAFNDMLQKYPPSLGRVLKLDPTLMTNPDYLAPYPGLAAFLAQHPEVAHNPGFFLERVPGGGSYTSTPRDQAREDFMNLLGNFTGFLVFLVVTGVLIWLIQMFVEHRRWNRLQKIQTDVHTKILDRFSSNEDLLAYIQTPAGRRFLESAPIPLHDESRPIGAPFSRILWSVQAGIVLAVAGIGVLFVSSYFTDEPAQFFLVVGTVILALGGGFIVSALAAYLLSQRLGLLEKPSTDHA